MQIKYLNKISIRRVFSKANKNIWFLYKEPFFSQDHQFGKLYYTNHSRGKVNNIQKDTRYKSSVNLQHNQVPNVELFRYNNQTKSKSSIELSPKHNNLAQMQPLQMLQLHLPWLFWPVDHSYRVHKRTAPSGISVITHTHR